MRRINELIDSERSFDKLYVYVTTKVSQLLGKACGLLSAPSHVLIVASVVVLAGCATTPEQQAADEQRRVAERKVAEQKSIAQVIGLATIRRIYLGDFGNAEASDLVREKVRMYLMRSPRFELVENPASADAVLTGAAGVQRRYDESVSVDPWGRVHGEGSTNFQGVGVLRLVDVRQEKAVWAFEYQRGFMFGGSASSRVANQIVDKLLRDAKKIDDYLARQGLKTP